MIIETWYTASDTCVLQSLASLEVHLTVERQKMMTCGISFNCFKMLDAIFLIVFVFVDFNTTRFMLCLILCLVYILQSCLAL